MPTWDIFECEVDDIFETLHEDKLHKAYVIRILTWEHAHKYSFISENELDDTVSIISKAQD